MRRLFLLDASGILKTIKQFKMQMYSTRLNNRLLIYTKQSRLFLVFFFSSLFALVDLVVLEGEGSLVGSNNTQPITDLVLLQELLGEVLDVSLGELERRVGDRQDDGRTVTGDSDVSREVSGTSVDLDTVDQVLFLEDVSKSGKGVSQRDYPTKAATSTNWSSAGTEQSRVNLR